MTLFDPRFGKVDNKILERGFGMVETPSSGSAYVKFEETYKEIKSKSGGKPEYKDVIMARVLIPGGDIFEKEMNEAGEQWLQLKHPQFYPSFLKFKESKTQEIEGTPISQFPALSLARVKQCEAQGILTVEQLAALTDTQLGALGMGARELREKAKAFLDMASKTDSGMKLVSENEKLKEENKELASQIKDLKKQIKKLKE